MTKPQIFLLCAPVGSGKTTILHKFCSPENCSGILSPKIEGVRYFQNIANGELIKMDADSGIQIGKHTFSEEAFKRAEKILEDEISSDKEWLIIDEIGPLEIRKNAGFYEILSKILRSNYTGQIKILIVVRDFLAQEFIQKFELNNAKILPLKFFTERFSDEQPNRFPLGIVLAGGESSRMKTDKALLKYSGKPQWKRVKDLLSPLCSEVIISVNKNQMKSWTGDYPDENFLADDQKFAGNGPITALLTAAEKFPDRTFFVAGIDYPLLELQHLITLNNIRTSNSEAVCFEKNGFTEPLISVIEDKALRNMQEYFAAGNTSVKKFLESLKLEKLAPENSDFLTNINSSEDFANFTKNRNDR